MGSKETPINLSSATLTAETTTGGQEGKETVEANGTEEEQANKIRNQGEKEEWDEPKQPNEKQNDEEKEEGSEEEHISDKVTSWLMLVFIDFLCPGFSNLTQ